jgi:hypothetical protein
MDSFDQGCRIESSVNQELDLSNNRAPKFSRLVWVLLAMNDSHDKLRTASSTIARQEDLISEKSSQEEQP